MRRRTALYLTLALLVPASAFALDGEGAGGLPRAGQLGVSASLDSCGIYENSVVCKIDASFNAVDGATSYTASVTRADGSVIDYGEIDGGGAASFWVPYAGDGTYTVQISAYGQVDADPQLDRVARDGSTAGPQGRSGSDGAAAKGARASDERQGADAGSADPGAGDHGSGPTTPPDETSCDEQDTPPGDAATKEADAAALAQEGQLPQSVYCPPADPPPTDPPPTDPGDPSGDPGAPPPPDGTTTTPADPPPAT